MQLIRQTPESCNCNPLKPSKIIIHAYNDLKRMVCVCTYTHIHIHTSSKMYTPTILCPVALTSLAKKRMVTCHVCGVAFELPSFRACQMGVDANGPHRFNWIAVYHRNCMNRILAGLYPDYNQSPVNLTRSCLTPSAADPIHP